MIMIADHPHRDTCEVCENLTELRYYTPSTPVCMACVMEHKGQGHRQAQDEDETK